MYIIPEVYKVEFYVIGDDGDAFAWEDDFEAARATPGAIRIEKVTHYLDDTEIVWPQDDAA